MTGLKTLLAGAALALATATVATAAPVVLTFEGLGNLERVNEFYNGGVGGSGSGPGTNYGVSFGSSALAIIDQDAGGSGNFGGEPSPSTVLFFLTGSAVLNIASGFDTGFSFFYSAINNPGTVNVYDGVGATGTLLASIFLPITPSNGGDPTGAFSPFLPIGVTFAGTARSVDFGGTVNQIGFDDITFGSAVPGTVVPEPASMMLLGAGLLGLAAVRRRAGA